ncbi:MAG: hypothetical protein WCQ99_03380 [Pseudomonadota bacterium]
MNNYVWKLTECLRGKITDEFRTGKECWSGVARKMVIIGKKGVVRHVSLFFYPSELFYKSERLS